MDTPDHYIVALKHVMAQRGFKQKHLVEKTGMSQGNVSMILTGERAGSLEAREAIARAVGLTHEEMLGLGRSLCGEGPRSPHENPMISKIVQMLLAMDAEGDKESIEHLFRIVEEKVEVKELKGRYKDLLAKTGTNE